MGRFVFVVLSCFLLLVTPSLSQTRFYNYYDSGLEFIEKGDWQRAITELKSSVSLEFEDASMKRTYGTRFIKYFPHREMGIAYYNLSEFEAARKELDLSLAYVESARAEEYLDLVMRNVPPSLANEMKKRALEQAEREQREKEDAEKRTKIESARQNLLPVGALTYDPLRVTQVGSRLALAVLPFQGKGEASKFVDASTEKMITQLVNLRRFKVIERGVLEEVLKEQRLQASGIVDEQRRCTQREKTILFAKEQVHTTV